MRVYPIAISSLYFSGKLNVFSTVFKIIAVSAAQHISEVSGTIRENAGAVRHVADSIRENSADAVVLGDMVKDVSQMASELEKLTQ